MMNLLDNGKINFIVAEHHQFSKKLPRGGHIVLHLLANKLAQRGHNSYIFADPLYPHENLRNIPQSYWIDPNPDSNISTWTFEPFSYPQNRTVSIFPNDYVGNPFNTIHNVRLILSHVYKKEEELWGEEDLVVKGGWSNFFSHKKKFDFFLPIVDYKIEEFYDTKEVRNGYCHILWKYTPENHEEILAPYNSRDVSDWMNQGGFDYLKKMFNSHEYFLTFDKKTYFTTLAAMCGCKAIILEPNSNVSYDEGLPFMCEKKQTPAEFRSQNTLNLFGVAFGVEDVEWANQTVHFAHNHVKSLSETSESLLDEFVNYWETKLL